MASTVSEKGQFLDEPPQYAGPNFWCSTRFRLAMVGFFGMIMVYSLRVNLSVAVVCMVDQEKVALLDVTNTTTVRVAECARVEDYASNLENATSEPIVDNQRGEFVWTKPRQGQLLGAFFYGYLFTQVLGGWLAQKVGGRVVLGGSGALAVLITLASPIGARISYWLLLVLRVMLGMCQGVVFPAFHTMWSHWAPPLERSKLVGLTYAGAQVGNVLTLPISGLLCDYGFDNGWPSIFYILGLFGALWCVAWFLCVADTPSEHKRIDPAERQFIEHSLADQVEKSGHQKASVPWLRVLGSMPVWAAIVGHFAGDWGAYMMFTSLPTFLADVFQFDLTSLGFIASIPYVFYWLCINVGGFLADTIRERKWLNTLNTRRLMMVIALGSQAVFLVASGYCSCGQEVLVIVLLTIGIGLSGFQYAGFITNYMDIAPEFAGPILGIGQTISCAAGIAAPSLMGTLTPNKTRDEWLNVFWLTAAILAAGTIFFVVFASGEVQPWAKVEEAGEEMKTLNGGEPEKNKENNGTVSDEDRAPVMA